MIARFNPTGTHQHNGNLKVRIDLYPELNDKTYPIHYVDHYDRELTQAELDDPILRKLVPTHKELNPCLCHFITIDPDATLGEVTTYIKAIFDRATVLELDNILSEQIEKDPRPSRLMSTKLGITKLGRDKRTEVPINLDALNDRFRGIAIKV